MNTGRAAHSATLLADGRVLIAGGFREEGRREISIASAEIYDPETNRFTVTGDLNEARNGHTATLLADGRVLIAGGWGPTGRSGTAELFDPQTGTFQYTASLAGPRAGMTATLLKNGSVLIAGGESARNAPQPVAEIFDPASEVFSPTGSLHTGRSAHTASLLLDGTVLIAGGNTDGNTVLSSAEIYDPERGEFTETGSMGSVRHKHAAVLLEDGQVLLVGGSDNRDWEGKYSSAEIYQPATGTFHQTANLNRERFKLAEAAVRLPDGNVLVGGGNRAIEIYDPEQGQFQIMGELNEDYYVSTATLLRNGCVLISGGYDGNIQPTREAWIYNSCSLS
jgi:hypothetical protein